MNSSAGMLSTTSSSCLSSSSSPSRTPEVLNANSFLMSKDLINTETLLLNELVLDIAHNLTSNSSLSLSRSAAPTNSNFKMQKYKLFAEQTDQTSSQINKHISRVGDLLTELKKSIQNQLQVIEQLNEPLVCLSKHSFNNELSSIFDGFTLVGRILADNLRHFLNNFVELTLIPIEQISRNFDTSEKEQAKKTLEKAFKERDLKSGKQHRKSQKSIDLSSVSNSFLGEDLSEKPSADNYYLHQKICEYLSHVYAEKTSSFNQLVKSLMEFYKSQMAYLEKSLTGLSSINDVVDESRVETLLKKFNIDQSKETKIISELNARCVYNESKDRANSTKHVKSCENLSVESRPRAGVVIKRSAERSPLFKNGYLLKKPHHQGVRNWLRRKCVAENGYFYIFHAEETEPPVKLNLILCDVKVDDHRKFRIFSGSNNRVYDFMAESDEDLREWVSILNMSKEDAFEKELTTDNQPEINDHKFNLSGSMSSIVDDRGYNRVVSDLKRRGGGEDKAQEYLVKTMIREVQNIDGNDRCCDCGAREADWLVTNLGILVCIECCGIHREMGVHISKTQSIKIDRLSPSQLIIARMSGNRLLNQIFEASLVDSSKKLEPKSTMEQRQKYIKIKYEQHLLADQHNPTRLVSQLCENILAGTCTQVFELILQLFVQDYDLMSPIGGGIDDSLSRNLLQFVLDNMTDEADYLFLVEFIVQNRDFPKNKYTINYSDRAGNTAVHHAVAQNRVESLKILLRANEIEANLKNRDGHSPLEMANILSRRECVQLLNSMLNNESPGRYDGYQQESNDYEQRSRPVIMRNGMGEGLWPTDENGGKRHHSKHNRVASDPFNLIKINHSVGGTIKNLPRLLEDRKMLHKAMKSQRHSEKFGNRPFNYLEPDQIDFSNKYKAIASYTSKNPNHLSFRQDDLIIVVDRNDDLYWSGFLEANPQKRGFFPSNLVNLYV